MSQLDINEAIKRCVRDCLDSEQPIITLETFLAYLKRDGWSEKDIRAVCMAATRILAIIADPDVDDSPAA